MRPTPSPLACRPCVNSARPMLRLLVVVKRLLKLLVRSAPSVTPPRLLAPLNRPLLPASPGKKRPARAAVPRAAGVQASASAGGVNAEIAVVEIAAGHRKLRPHEEYIMAKLRIKWVKSSIGYAKDQKAT